MRENWKPGPKGTTYRELKRVESGVSGWLSSSEPLLEYSSGFSFFQSGCLSTVFTAYLSLERERPSQYGQFQELPKAFELFIS